MALLRFWSIYEKRALLKMEVLGAIPNILDMEYFI